jgi:hypothetical protein
MYKKIPENTSLLRDTNSNAIINFDTDGFNSYINTRERLYSQRSKIDGLESQVSILTDELGKIKKILENMIH